MKIIDGENIKGFMCSAEINIKGNLVRPAIQLSLNLKAGLFKSFNQSKMLSKIIAI